MSGEEITYSVEDLGDYLDRGRRPYEPAIEESPEYLSTLRALERIRDLSGALIADDATALPTVGDDWFASVISHVRREARAGRSIPLPSSSPEVTLTITEGAVRGIVREAGDSVPGVLIGRCVLDGDVSDRDAEIRVEITASVFWGVPLREAAQSVRERVYTGLLAQTELAVTAIDVRIDDVYLSEEGEPVSETGASGGSEGGGGVASSTHSVRGVGGFPSSEETVRDEGGAS